MANEYCIFLAHLSRRLKWAIAITFRPSSVVRRASCVVRRPSSVVRRASCVNFFRFSSSSPKVVIGFSPNLVRIILRGRGFKVVQIIRMGPMGALGEGPKGPNLVQFQTSSSPEPKVAQSNNFVCIFLYICRIKVVHVNSGGGPFWALWAPLEKSHFLIFFPKILVTY